MKNIFFLTVFFYITHTISMDLPSLLAGMPMIHAGMYNLSSAYTKRFIQDSSTKIQGGAIPSLTSAYVNFMKQDNTLHRGFNLILLIGNVYFVYSAYQRKHTDLQKIFNLSALVFHFIQLTTFTTEQEITSV